MVTHPPLYVDRSRRRELYFLMSQKRWQPVNVNKWTTCSSLLHCETAARQQPNLHLHHEAKLEIVLQPQLRNWLMCEEIFETQHLKLKQTPKLMQKQSEALANRYKTTAQRTIKTITNHCGCHGHLPPSTVRGTACWAQCRGRVWTERPGLRSLYRWVWAPLWWDRDCWTSPESWLRTRRCHSWWRRDRKSEGEAEKFQKRQH